VALAAQAQPGRHRVRKRQLARSHGRCLSSVSILGIRPEAYELIAYSDLHRDMPGLAIRAMRKAVSLDRNNWNYAYGLALMEAAGA